LPGIEATKARLETSAEERAAHWKNVREERATSIDASAPILGGARKRSGFRSDASIVANLLNEAVRPLDFLFSLIDPQKTPGQLRTEAIKAEADREAQAEAQIDFSNYKADRAQEQRNQQEQEAVRDRQREIA